MYMYMLIHLMIINGNLSFFLLLEIVLLSFVVNYSFLAICYFYNKLEVIFLHVCYMDMNEFPIFLFQITDALGKNNTEYGHLYRHCDVTKFM